MQYQQFIQNVQQAAATDSPVEVERAVQATLATLGELLSRKERSDLASELPKPLQEYVEEKRAIVEGRDRTRRFSLEEFYNRVAARADVGYPAAVRRSGCVMRVLSAAVSQGELTDVFSELPADYDELLRVDRTSAGPPKHQ